MPAGETATPEIRLQRKGGVAWLVLSNPARMNALTASMWSDIPDLLRTAETDDDVRVIVLRGEGDKAFSAGADISEFESARTGEAARTYDALNHAAFEAFSNTTKPLIAMIHGFCLGGGLGLAACCDLRLADEASEFAIPAARLGIGYNPRWVRTLLALAHPAHVKERLFTARRFKSQEALAMGLVNRIVPSADLAAATEKLATEIGANAPLSLRAAKLAIDEITRHPETTDITRLDVAIEACFQSDDYAEGRRAFLEKRRPRFQGR